MRILLVIIALTLPVALFAQYPREVRPGQSLTVNAGNDTLWILKNRQFDACIVAGEKLKIANELNDTLKEINQKNEEKIVNLEKNVADYKEGYDRYKVKWEESDKENEKLEIKLEEQKHKTKIVAILSGVGSALLTALIFIAL